MERIIDCIGIIILGILSWQDFRSREIAWWLLPLLAAVFFFSSLLKNTVNEIGRGFSFNIVFMLVQFLFIWVWFSVKNKKISRLINSEIGLGDILFLVCIALAFSPANFLVFYILGMTATLMVTIVIRLIRSGKENEIPLAGALAIPLIVLFGLQIIDPAKNFHDDDWLNSLLDSNI